MQHDKKLKEYLEICKKLWDELEHEGSWLWSSDSLNSDDVIDSEDNSDNI